MTWRRRADISCFWASFGVMIGQKIQSRHALLCHGSEEEEKGCIAQKATYCPKTADLDSYCCSVRKNPCIFQDQAWAGCSSYTSQEDFSFLQTPDSLHSFRLLQVPSSRAPASAPYAYF